MKERLTVTIDKDIINIVDHYVDGIKVKNRSHAIEVLLKEALEDSIASKALILAGGRGTRLRPITREIPKPLIPVHGKTLLEHIFDLLKKYHIRNVILSIGYLGDKIKEFFGDGSKFGMKIQYIEENEPMGTAGPLRLARPFLKGNFIVCNADELKDINVEDMMLFHKEHNAMATIALTTLSDTECFGVAEMQGDHILNFTEKPEPGTKRSNLVNAGFYIMNMSVIDMIPEGKSMLETDIFPKIAGRGKLIGYPFTGQWYATDTHERYEYALDNWKDIKG
ncbi:MAG: sugar phosphate nucleotidyltransferase [Candidatus Woesearchaeota archaeon]